MNLLNLIDTRVGTDNTWEQSVGNGNTLPYTCVPFAMNHYVLQTRLHDRRFFNPNDYSQYGIRLTHQPSPWMGDFSSLLMNAMAYTSEEVSWLQSFGDSDEKMIQMTRSSYNPDQAKFQPHCLSYRRLRDSIQMTLIPSFRGATLSVVPDLRRAKEFNRQLFFSIAIPGDRQLELDEGGFKISGYTDNLSQSKYHQFGMHFLAYLNQKVEVFHRALVSSEMGQWTYYWFKVDDYQAFEVNIVCSYISIAQAELNYQSDMFFAETDLNNKLTYSAECWLDYLNRIEVEHQDLEKVRLFYHNLYRTAIFPQTVHEISKEGERIHFSPISGNVEKGAFYTNNGYWDTFRTNYPLYSLVIPEMIPLFIEGILNVARQDQYLPKWLSPDERATMPGTLVDAVIADAVVKGLVDDETAQELLDAMIYTAEEASEDELEGREGTQDYQRLGYLPSEYKESVNKTLDYAYSDFCIGQVAGHLGHRNLAKKYYQRAYSYRNIYNTENGYMWPKNAEGQFIEGIVPHRWGGHFTEGSAVQHSTSVCYNVADLIRLHGGDQAFIDFMNQLVNSDSIYQVGDYFEDFHEISELARLRFGQLAISNQPSFHMPYLYIYAGAPQLSHMLIRALLDNVFNLTYQGYCGDEDNGSMASWYVLSSLGLYAVSPGVDEYVLGISIWNRVTIHLSNGHQIIIESDPQEPYLNLVKERTINKELYLADYVKYHDLMQGMIIHQHLGIMPEFKLKPQEYRPYSLSCRGDV